MTQMGEIIKSWLITKLTRKKLNKFIEQNRSDLYTLDIGCSNSPYSKFFPNRIGFDINKGEGVDVVGDAHNQPFNDNKFDIILCTEVLEHLRNPKVAISEMRRVLKPNGKLILTTRFIFPLHDTPGDYYRYTIYGLRELFKDGWKIEKVEYEANTIQTIAILIQRIAFQCDILWFRPFKLFLLILSKIIYCLSFVITKEYGDKTNTKEEKNILSSGYYIVAIKKEKRKK
jgi:SAM-dependent methyltransferase